MYVASMRCSEADEIVASPSEAQEDEHCFDDANITSRSLDLDDASCTGIGETASVALANAIQANTPLQSYPHGKFF